MALEEHTIIGVHHGIILIKLSINNNRKSIVLFDLFD